MPRTPEAAIGVACCRPDGPLCCRAPSRCTWSAGVDLDLLATRRTPSAPTSGSSSPPDTERPTGPARQGVHATCKNSHLRPEGRPKPDPRDRPRHSFSRSGKGCANPLASREGCSQYGLRFSDNDATAALLRLVGERKFEALDREAGGAVFEPRGRARRHPMSYGGEFNCSQRASPPNLRHFSQRGHAASLARRSMWVTPPLPPVRRDSHSKISEKRS